jgi:hypothetical protein
MIVVKEKSENLIDELEALARSLGVSAEQESGASLLEDVSGLEEEFGDLLPSGKDGALKSREQSLNKLIESLEQGRKIVAALRGIPGSDNVHRRKEAQLLIHSLDNLRSRINNLLERVEKRLEQLRQEIANLA